MDASDYMRLFAGAAGMSVVGAAVLVALRLLPPSQPSEEADAIRVLLSVIGWCLMLMGMLGVSHFLMPAGLGLLHWFALVIVLLMALNRSRNEKRQALLQMLALAVRRQIPLASAAAATADETGGKIGRQCEELALRLQRGDRLDRALQTLPGVLPRRSRPLVHLGLETGCLDAALEEATAERDPTSILGQWMTQLLYFAALLFVATSVLMFVMIKIVPAFKTIFEDFGTELPAITQLLIDLSTLFVNYWYLFSPFWLLLMGLLIYSVLLYLGWIDWEPPFLNRVTDRFDTATILRGLAVVAEAQRPLLHGVQALTAVYPKDRIRRRLAQVAGEMALGVDWCDSLWANRLISATDAGLLRAAEKVGNLAWALRMAADSHERRLAYRLRLLLEVGSPMALLAIAMTVAFVVVALFMPLIKIIETLT